jgi:hypothetical protein
VSTVGIYPKDASLLFWGAQFAKAFLLLCDMIQVERQNKHLAASTTLDARTVLVGPGFLLPFLPRQHRAGYDIHDETT